MNDHELTQQYLDFPREVETVLTGLSPLQLNLRLRSESWSIRQITLHLADADEIGRHLIKVALGSPGVSYPLDWYGQRNTWASTLVYADRDPDPVLTALRAERLVTAQLLRHVPNALESRIHLTRSAGEPRLISVRELMTDRLQHGRHHLQQI